MAKLKVAVLVPDGAADNPVESLGGRTPLEAAATPNSDRIASLGATGTIGTIPDGMQPGSDIANLSLLGYDPRRHYGGRGPVEAANLGVRVPEGWTAFRCNLVQTDGLNMIDYSAGHITSEEAGEIIDTLNAAIADGETRFHQGKSYRQLLIMKGEFAGLATTPPHDITGREFGPYLPEGPGAGRVREVMEAAAGILEDLPVNRRRSCAGLPAADMIWPWGQGAAMTLAPFEDLYGITGGVISAVDLVNGLGVLAGLAPVPVPGITGFLDTNYRGKGEAAVRVLEKQDFVYVHVEAPDEASHIGDTDAKVTAIERFDEMVAGPVLDFAESEGGCRVLVCPDHPTFLSTRTHDGGSVPYAVFGPGIEPGGFRVFSEKTARTAGPHFPQGWTLMGHLCGGKPWPGAVDG